jgi:hypothetical protein
MIAYRLSGAMCAHLITGRPHPVCEIEIELYRSDSARMSFSSTAVAVQDVARVEGSYRRVDPEEKKDMRLMILLKADARSEAGGIPGDA